MRNRHFIFDGKHRDQVWVHGRQWPVIERLSIGRRVYLVLDRRGRGLRRRDMALDPSVAPEGELRSVLRVPATAESRQNIRLLKRVSNQNINLPQLLDYEERDRELRVITTWVNGRDLRSFLTGRAVAGKRYASPFETVRLLRGLAHGLGQLLRCFALIHGDIKPENLIVARRPSRLVMIDYGSAWSLPRTRQRGLGDGISPAYSAPELQTECCVPDSRCDQFSTSVVAYEMLTGRLPYDSLGGQAGRPEFRSRMKNELIPPSRLAHEASRLPRSLWISIDRIILKGLQLDQEERFPTAVAWMTELDQLFSSMQIKPRRQHRMGRIASWLDRRSRKS